MIAPIIWVLIIGFIYSAASHFFDLGIPSIPLDPEIVLYAFVPLLVFASTQKICLSNLKKVLAPACLTASAGILISMVLMALPLYYFMSFTLLEALMLGVILSATDPLAVGALLEGNKQVTESQKLLIEGESILNDGFVVTVSGIIGVMIFEDSEFSILVSGREFLQHVFGAILLGIIIARGGRWLIDKWHSESFSLRTNMTLSIAYGSFALGELIQVSGILAVFAAALAYGYKPKEDDRNKHIHRHLWEYFEYLSNAVLFFLLGASFFVYFSTDSLTPLLICILLFFLAAPRLISLFLLRSFIEIDDAKMKISGICILNFAGARGAIPIALILLLPDSFELKQACLSIAFLMIFLSLLIYPICLRKILQHQNNTNE